MWVPHGRRQCDSRCTYGARVASRLCGTATKVRAPRGAHIATTSDDRGFTLAMWTWVVDSLLKPLPFRQEVRRLSPNSDILVDLGVPKGGETGMQRPSVLPTVFK
jgi:hypothetical protein